MKHRKAFHIMIFVIEIFQTMITMNYTDGYDKQYDLELNLIL